MKRKYRLSLSFAALFCITALGFNNCGQPGDIALKAANNSSSTGDGGGGGGGSGDDPNNSDQIGRAHV